MYIDVIQNNINKMGIKEETNNPQKNQQIKVI